jgi:hypothetical protein
VPELVKHDAGKENNNEDNARHSLPRTSLDQMHGTDPDEQKEERRMHADRGPATSKSFMELLANMLETCRSCFKIVN